MQLGFYITNYIYYTIFKLTERAFILLYIFYFIKHWVCGENDLFVVYWGSLFHTILSSSTPNFAILSLPILIRLHTSFIEDTWIDLPCGTTWQLCPEPRASVRNSALPLSCPRDVPSEPGSSADPPYHAPDQMKSTVRKQKWMFPLIICMSFILVHSVENQNTSIHHDFKISHIKLHHFIYLTIYLKHALFITCNYKSHNHLYILITTMSKFCRV